METVNETPSRFNDMQLIKRSLFAMRNGIIADTLRRAGSPFRIIFGVNLPQLVDIAARFGPDRDLAEALWANSTTRESMLIAPMLMPKDTFTEADAMRWVSSVPVVEVADILAHRLLRHMPYAMNLAQTLAATDDYMSRYTGLRLMCNIASRYPDEARAMGRSEMQRADARTASIAAQLSDYE